MTAAATWECPACHDTIVVYGGTAVGHLCPSKRRRWTDWQRCDHQPRRRDGLLLDDHDCCWQCHRRQILEQSRSTRHPLSTDSRTSVDGEVDARDLHPSNSGNRSGGNPDTAA